MGAIRVLRKKRRQAPLTGASTTPLIAEMIDLQVAAVTEFTLVVQSEGVTVTPSAIIGIWRMWAKSSSTGMYQSMYVDSVGEATFNGVDSRVVMTVGDQADLAFPAFLLIPVTQGGIAGPFGQEITVANVPAAGIAGVVLPYLP